MPETALGWRLQAGEGRWLYLWFRRDRQGLGSPLAPASSVFAREILAVACHTLPSQLWEADEHIDTRAERPGNAPAGIDRHIHPALALLN